MQCVVANGVFKYVQNAWLSPSLARSEAGLEIVVDVRITAFLLMNIFNIPINTCCMAPIRNPSGNSKFYVTPRLYSGFAVSLKPSGIVQSISRTSTFGPWKIPSIAVLHVDLIHCDTQCDRYGTKEPLNDVAKHHTLPKI